MGNAPAMASASLALAVGIVVAAGILGGHIVWDRRQRDEMLGDEDLTHFYFQDLRRSFGVMLMALLGVGIYFGSRLPAFVTGPAGPGLPLERHPSHVFLGVWFAVMSCVVLLLALAMVDWIATRRYARRHRRELDRRRAEILRETIRRSPSDDDGLVNGRSF